MKYTIKLTTLKKYTLKEIKFKDGKLELFFNYKTSSFKITIEKTKKNKYSIYFKHGKKNYQLTKYYLKYLLNKYKELNLFINLR